MLGTLHKNAAGLVTVAYWARGSGPWAVQAQESQPRAISSAYVTLSLSRNSTFTPQK